MHKKQNSQFKDNENQQEVISDIAGAGSGYFDDSVIQKQEGELEYNQSLKDQEEINQNMAEKPMTTEAYFQIATENIQVPQRYRRRSFDPYDESPLEMATVDDKINKIGKTHSLLGDPIQNEINTYPWNKGEQQNRVNQGQENEVM